jgi:hypothetical protein
VAVSTDTILEVAVIDVNTYNCSVSYVKKVLIYHRVYNSYVKSSGYV